MKQKAWWLLLALATAVQGATLDTVTPQLPELRPLMQQPRAAHLTAELVNHLHYKAVPLDDGLSAKVFDNYLKSLDSDKAFFLQADIDSLSDARARLGDAILGEDLRTPFAIFNLYRQRAVERFTYARSLLKDGFDFKQNDGYRFLREKDPWPKSEAEVREVWRERVKNDWLTLKIAGKDDKKIVETLDRRYQNSVKRIGKLKSEDAFDIFMNAYTMAVEPHTNYMGPRDTEAFDISMKLSMEGIGAVLLEKDEYATIKEFVPGGPAILSGKLKVGDRILGVAQGKDGPMTDVVGWRLDDTVALIRGAADSVVMLDVLPADAGPAGKSRSVALVRKKISLETQAAKKSILTYAEGGVTHRIGVINLSTFYEDFAARQKGDPDYRSASRDVARLLAGLKKDKVEAVLIDLRNNGGGSLTEAIDLTGLFIDTGPVVQQRDARGRISVGRDTRAGTAWDGPLGVLINRGSASASEIFAAAIQDYGRGLVIGEPSFGKGTVQTMVEVDQLAHKPQFGEVKLTIAQFFRVNGGTTQLRGVTPDISLPSASDPSRFGESSYDNALPWMQIPPAEYRPVGDLHTVLPILQSHHDARVATNKDFQTLLQDITEIRLQRQKNFITLNEAQRRKEHSAQEARSKLLAKEASPAAKASAASKASVLKNDDGDDGDKERKDPFLEEAGHILGDESALLRPRASLTARNQAAAPQ